MFKNKSRQLKCLWSKQRSKKSGWNIGHNPTNPTENAAWTPGLSRKVVFFSLKNFISTHGRWQKQPRRAAAVFRTKVTCSGYNPRDYWCSRRLSGWWKCLVRLWLTASISQSLPNRVKSDDVTNNDAVACLLLLIDRIVAFRIIGK